jgi:hypothetical protein
MMALMLSKVIYLIDVLFARRVCLIAPASFSILRSQAGVPPQLLGFVRAIPLRKNREKFLDPYPSLCR